MKRMGWFLILVPAMMFFVDWGWVEQDGLMIGSTIPISIRYVGIAAIGAIGFVVLFSSLRLALREDRKRAPPTR